MSRLRTHTTYNRRSYESESEKPKRVFVIAFEGNATEIQYFYGIKNNRERLGIPNIINIEILERDDTKSAPKHVVALLEEYIQEGYTDEFIKNFEHNINDAQFGDSAKNIIKKYFEGTLTDKIKEEVERLIYEADTDRVYYEYMENWKVESKEFCVVFDRDVQSTKPWSFSQVIKNCNAKGYIVAFTNPCFEFWLLLHHCDVKAVYSLEEIKENKRISTNKKFIDGELTKILGGYNKTNIKFEEVFMDNVDMAIQREKEYAINWKDMVNDVGSNIGILIEQMRQK